ncbi:hypothetical protein ACFPOU_17935 [Massilia jejuensis]|uniref:Uncharacterized protein n=1 Tax=Massilia jejuensis TaxID=648894 RepID=A0ABW0PKK9_9BURK
MPKFSASIQYSVIALLFAMQSVRAGESAAPESAPEAVVPMMRAGHAAQARAATDASPQDLPDIHPDKIDGSIFE